jgi:hypothetical protein
LEAGNLKRLRKQRQKLMPPLRRRWELIEKLTIFD